MPAQRLWTCYPDALRPISTLRPSLFSPPHSQALYLLSFSIHSSWTPLAVSQLLPAKPSCPFLALGHSPSIFQTRLHRRPMGSPTVCPVSDSWSLLRCTASACVDRLLYACGFAQVGPPGGHTDPCPLGQEQRHGHTFVPTGADTGSACRPTHVFACKVYPDA